MDRATNSFSIAACADYVENNVIADQLKELSKGELVLENPDELVNTNTLLRSMGLNQNQNQNKLVKNKNKNKNKQNKNKNFKK